MMKESTKNLIISLVFLVVSCQENIPSQSSQEAVTFTTYPDPTASATVNPTTPKILTVLTNFSNHVWAQLNYSVTGGGDIAFFIVPISGQAELIIRVTRYRFQTRNDTIYLTPSNSPTLYNDIASILDSSYILSNGASGGVSGSWQQVTL